MSALTQERHRRIARRLRGVFAKFIARCDERGWTRTLEERLIDKVSRMFNLRWQARSNLRCMIKECGIDMSDDGIDYFINILYLRGTPQPWHGLPKRYSRHARHKHMPNFQAKILAGTYSEAESALWR